MQSSVASPYPEQKFASPCIGRQEVLGAEVNDYAIARSWRKSGRKAHYGALASEKSDESGDCPEGGLVQTWPRVGEARMATVMAAEEGIMERWRDAPAAYATKKRKAERTRAVYRDVW